MNAAAAAPCPACASAALPSVCCRRHRHRRAHRRRRFNAVFEQARCFLAWRIRRTRRAPPWCRPPCPAVCSLMARLVRRRYVLCTWPRALRPSPCFRCAACASAFRDNTGIALCAASASEDIYASHATRTSEVKPRPFARTPSAHAGPLIVGHLGRIDLAIHVRGARADDLGFHATDTVNEFRHAH